MTVTNSGRSRLTLTVLLASAATLVFAGFAFAGASTGSDTDNISITQELTQPGDTCASRADSMSMTSSNTADAFTIVVTVEDQLCVRIDAAATIYLMPLDGSLWPQTLSEKVEVSFFEPGVTTVVFNKFCVPAQFDIIVGATPATISPIGPFHGPLLFPPTDLGGNGGSALQFTGDGDCTTTSTTSTTSSTSTTSTPDTSVPVTVESVTTSSIPGTPGSVTNTPTVAGSTATNSGGASISVAG